MLNMNIELKKIIDPKPIIQAVICALYLCATPVYADDFPDMNVAEPQNLLSLAVGGTNIFDDEDNDMNIRAEYRSSHTYILGISPYVGVDINSGGSWFLGGGLYKDFHITESTSITPSLGVFYYEQGGSDLDLGHPVEFRSQIEIGYSFDDQRKLSVALSHYSNASLDDDNPGTEMLNLYYHIPLNQFSL